MGPEGIILLINTYQQLTGRKLARIHLPDDRFATLAHECERLCTYPAEVTINFASSEFQVMGVTIGKSNHSKTWELIEGVAQNPDW